MKIAKNSETVDLKKIKSVNTYAKIINRTTQQAYNHIRDGKVPSIQIDGKFFVII